MKIDERIEAARKLEGYTPGPWRVGIDDDGNPLSGRPGVFSSDELDCGIVHWDGFVQKYWRSARGDKEIHDNARLIAAAPDLHRLVLDLAAERERLRAALAAIAEDRVPPYEPVRSNRCVHRRTMDEDCKHCVKAFARAGLNQETPDAEA